MKAKGKGSRDATEAVLEGEVVEVAVTVTVLVEDVFSSGYMKPSRRVSLKMQN